MQKSTTRERDKCKPIDTSVSQLDEQRLIELHDLKQLQEIKNKVLELESERLEKKYGDQNRRVQETNLQLEYNQKIFSGLDKEIERASIKTEPFPYNSWRVNGKVFDKQIVPVKGVTIYLSDQNKKWIEKLGNSCTNEKGFYSLTVDAALVAGYEKKKQPLYVSVSDKNKKLLYMASEPLYAHKGLIDYLDIFLNDKECVSPPPGTDDKLKKAAQ